MKKIFLILAVLTVSTTNILFCKTPKAKCVLDAELMFNDIDVKSIASKNSVLKKIKGAEAKLSATDYAKLENAAKKIDECLTSDKFLKEQKKIWLNNVGPAVAKLEIALNSSKPSKEIKRVWLDDVGPAITKFKSELSKQISLKAKEVIDKTYKK